MAEADNLSQALSILTETMSDLQASIADMNIAVKENSAHTKNASTRPESFIQAGKVQAQHVPHLLANGKVATAASALGDAVLPGRKPAIPEMRIRRGQKLAEEYGLSYNEMRQFSTLKSNESWKKAAQEFGVNPSTHASKLPRAVLGAYVNQRSEKAISGLSGRKETNKTKDANALLSSYDRNTKNQEAKIKSDKTKNANTLLSSYDKNTKNQEAKIKSDETKNANTLISSLDKNTKKEENNLIAALDKNTKAQEATLTRDKDKAQVQERIGKYRVDKQIEYKRETEPTPTPIGLKVGGAIGGGIASAGVQYALTQGRISQTQALTTYGSLSESFQQSQGFTQQRAEALGKSAGTILDSMGDAAILGAGVSAGTGVGAPAATLLAGTGVALKGASKIADYFGREAGIDAQVEERQKFLQSSFTKALGFTEDQARTLGATDTSTQSVKAALQLRNQMGGRQTASSGIAAQFAALTHTPEMNIGVGLGLGNPDYTRQQNMQAFSNIGNFGRLRGNGRVYHSLQQLGDVSREYGVDALSVSQNALGSAFTTRDLTQEQIMEEFAYAQTRSPVATQGLQKYNQSNFVQRLVTNKMMQAFTGSTMEDFASGRADISDMGTSQRRMFELVAGDQYRTAAAFSAAGVTDEEHDAYKTSTEKAVKESGILSEEQVKQFNEQMGRATEAVKEFADTMSVSSPWGRSDTELEQMGNATNQFIPIRN